MIMIIVVVKKEGLGDEIAEEVNKLEGVIGGDGIGDLREVVQGHSGVDEGDDGNAEAMGLEDDRGLAVRVEDDEAIRGLSGTEAELLVAGAELLGAEAIGEEATGAPERVHGRGVAADLLGHVLDDLVKQWVGVHEHESALLLSQGGDELGGVAEADEGFVRVHDRRPIATSVREHLQMLTHHTPP
ncbi:hypothetical protein TorRG33x02_338250 [Trema orientale]|uniref:Uncharacterized protein n=1 Tax=Trema orientale TaxID=63057 RepID=A0A2P5AXW1_TREOI|nr:hypothetical protein TorRG33x02_338250 [Trema orientale]